ncbi:hypothetical protein BsWGS_22917 [Bradybaena similaris]
MAASNTDTGIVELDKLIHSLEFENQQYVKMIEKENQLISSLESQIEEKVQQTLKLEQDITRFDEDTRRLHRLYTNNRDNVESLRNTISVLSDHETALSRQLEATRSKTEESRKFYAVQLANYSSIEDEYMKKYTNFPLAIELEKKKHALATTQRQFDDIMAAKQDLEGKIALKEGELDSKIMTRIIIKIAKIQLANTQLRKDIDERLAEKAGLLEKLQEIRTTKSTGQDEQCGESHADGANVLSMEIDDMQQLEDSSKQVFSDEFEGFSNMSITEGPQKSSSGDGQQPCPASDAEEMSIRDTADSRCPDEASTAMQEKQVPELNVVTAQPWSIPTHTDGGRMFTANEPVSSGQDLNKASASDQINMETVVAEQRQENVQITCADETLVLRSAPIAKLRFPLLSKIRPPPTIHMPVLQNLDKLPEHRMAPALNTESQKIAGDVNAEDKSKPSSSHAPQVSIPSLSRILVPPSINIRPMQKQLKLPEHVTTPEPCAEMKKVPPPSVSMLQDLRQKMSLLVPKSPLLPSSQQNQQYSLSKTLEVTEKTQVDHHPQSLQTSQAQVSQSQTVPPSSITETFISKQGHSTSLPSNQQTPSSDATKVTVEKQDTSVQGLAKIQASTECSVSTSRKTTDVEVPTKGCDSPPSEPVQNFNINIQGFNSGDSSTQSPKGMFSKCTNRRSPSSEGGHNFLLQSLFGNFEKELGEDHYESDEETAPTSIFSFFNISQSSGGGAHEDSKDAGSFFTFGKFTENTGSPSSEGPSSLLNLFTKSQNSDTPGQDFAVNIEEAGKEHEMTTFTFGVAVDERSEGHEGQDRPLFNLF